MRVKFLPPYDMIRGMHSRTKGRSSHGFTMRPGGSQVFSRRVAKRNSLSAAETAGKRSMQIILHAFSHLTQAQRLAWHSFRELIKREWHVKTNVGPEQTHPKEITYSDLDFYVACNHYRVLGGLDPVGTPIITAQRHRLVIRKVYRSSIWENTFVFKMDLFPYSAGEPAVWAQASPPFNSPQRHPTESEYYAMATPFSKSYIPIWPAPDFLNVIGNRYPIKLGRIQAVRFLQLNPGGAPYGYATWRGVVDEERP